MDHDDDKQQTYEERVEQQIVKSLLQHTPPILQEHFIRNCCIAATAIGLEVLHYWGVQASPLAVSLMACNEYAARYIEEHGLPLQVSDPDLEAHQKAGYTMIMVGRTGQNVPDTWNGHLVIATANSMVDLSLGGYSRPEWSIPLQAASFDLPPEARVEGALLGYKLPGGVTISYSLYPDDHSYRDTPDFQRGKHKKLVGRLIRSIHEDLAHGGG